MLTFDVIVQGKKVGEINHDSFLDALREAQNIHGNRVRLGNARVR